MIDIVREIQASSRGVGEATTPGGAAHVVRLERTYDAPVDDVWDAVTSPDRIARWFLPISGDLRLGGTYQFEGNAGGTILACERPNRLQVTWVFGDPTADPSILELRLAAADGDMTRLELEHTAIVPDEFWSEYGPGAVGVGWDGAALGLALHLRGGSIDDPAEWAASAEGREFYRQSSEAWGAAHLASGADPDAAAHAVAGTYAFYAPEPVPGA
jgi:uncharacterized protein YndB with AHSA1/START domain